jgi:hypothetical protein
MQLFLTNNFNVNAIYTIQGGSIFKDQGVATELLQHKCRKLRNISGAVAVALYTELKNLGRRQSLQSFNLGSKLLYDDLAKAMIRLRFGLGNENKHYRYKKMYKN